MILNTLGAGRIYGIRYTRVYLEYMLEYTLLCFLINLHIKVPYPANEKLD